MQFEAVFMEDVPSLSMSFMSRESSLSSDFCRTPSDIDTGLTTLGRFTAGDDGFFKALEAGLIAKGAFAGSPSLCKEEKLTIDVSATPDVQACVAIPSTTNAGDNCIFACDSVQYQAPASVGTTIKHNVTTLPSAPVQATTFDFDFQDGFKREFVDLLSTYTYGKFETKAVSPIIENDDCAAPPNSPIHTTSGRLDFNKLSFPDRLCARLEEKCEVIGSVPKAEVHTCSSQLCLATRNCTGVPARYRDDAPAPTFSEYWKPDGRPTLPRSTGPSETVTLADLEPYLEIEEADEQVDEYPKPLLEDDRSFNRAVKIFTHVAHALASVYESDGEEESFEYEEVKVVDNDDICAGALELFDCLEDRKDDVLVL